MRLAVEIEMESVPSWSLKKRSQEHLRQRLRKIWLVQLLVLVDRGSEKLEAILGPKLTLAILKTTAEPSQLQRIRKIRSDSGAQINISNPENDCRTITVTGDEESTGKAKHMLQRAVNEFGSGGM